MRGEIQTKDFLLSLGYHSILAVFGPFFCLGGCPHSHPAPKGLNWSGDGGSFWPPGRDTDCSAARILPCLSLGNSQNLTKGWQVAKEFAITKGEPGWNTWAPLHPHPHTNTSTNTPLCHPPSLISLICRSLQYFMRPRCLIMNGKHVYREVFLTVDIIEHLPGPVLRSYLHLPPDCQLAEQSSLAICGGNLCVCMQGTSRGCRKGKKGIQEDSKI